MPVANPCFELTQSSNYGHRRQSFHLSVVFKNPITNKNVVRHRYSTFVRIFAIRENPYANTPYLWAHRVGSTPIALAIFRTVAGRG